ncbi:MULTISPECIES: hypothetical protein [unclassified Pseudomonas]|uniref:hypothetical protein n=1 Tax=unclassified Pseudomonas TaxID=196821 RepID=UPI0008766525|nr:MULTISPECIES: hypothetical protein [unclassified Pseudomonas]SCZ75911.1 hypothetical protein SAMN03159460_06209 [Pseudomonas sp. NFPP17]SDA89974.1 hypothetical protein SAMN03159464_06237 [Pseudomonas sp. NFPP15]SEL73042.1 hypothetical protein SAMN03159324_05088 [Pseudomonas sp. NFPP18]SFA66378.1 hypothetical protein SAMN03159320_04906 [Pseudomonas sp. NFPP13]SFU13240.1 hypothetical protein SAMN03159492_06163 [Pseudomonas sp. NFPP25]
MKRIFGLTLCLLATSMAQAEQKLRVIDLGDDAPVSAEAAERGRQAIAAQEAAKKIKPEEARDFLKRLNKTVEHGQTLALSGAMDGKQAREQAIALKKLMDESDRFGSLFAPFAKCRSAAIDANTSWQGMISQNVRQYSEGNTSYQANAKECAQAAG